ncbi:hypothetical protein CR513_61546, partial [Mucuna pruriens]
LPPLPFQIQHNPNLPPHTTGLTLTHIIPTHYLCCLKLMPSPSSPYPFPPLSLSLSQINHINSQSKFLPLLKKRKERNLDTHPSSKYSPLMRKTHHRDIKP